jgi:hypothetical protein
VATFRRVTRTPEFQKDLKRLKKRFRTLDGDLQEFIDTQLNLTHKQGIDNGGVFPITGTKFSYPPSYIAKKFTCRSLPGTGCRSGFRVVYVYWSERDEIALIEIFFKGDQKGRDVRRLNAYLSSQLP